MKKLTILLMLSFVSMILSAQVIEHTYSFDKAELTEIQGYNQLNIKDCMQSAELGNPTLPYKSVSLLLPYGTEAESVEVILSDFEEIALDKQLFPYQSSLPYSKPERKNFVKNEDIYSSKSVYPQQSHGVLTTNYLNGYAFAFTAFTPVKYEPSSYKLFYAKTAKVRITLKSSKEDKSEMLWNTPYINNRICSLSDNPEMIETYKSKGRNLSEYEMLIITSEQYVTGFEEYMEYYESIGVRNEIVTVEEIYSVSEGIDSQDKIRNYIIQEYSEKGIMMVLLGGDVNIVPYRGFYCQVQSSSLEVDNGIPADLYYCALDGNWNDDNDDKWAEIGEDDLLPEIGIARMSFDNASKQANMINKTLKYQREPVLGEFRKITLAGEWLYDDPQTYGSQYLELLIGEHNDNGYTTIGIPEDYDFTRLYAENSTWGPNPLMAAINAGTQYVNHVGHANTTTVAEWYNSDITDANFSGANGVDHNYTFFHSHGCICGSFDDDCIMERMVSIQNFAVAAIGNSRYGWFNEGQTEGPAAHLHREMTDAQYNDRIQFLGLALTDSKCQTAPFVNAPGQWEEGALRWNFYDLNIIGDVAARPWIDEPFNAQIQYDEQIIVGTSSTEIVIKNENNEAQKGFCCNLLYDGELIGSAISDENGLAEIIFNEPLNFVGELQLYVTGFNAFPQNIQISVIPNNTAYVVYEDYVINDENSQMDYNESVTMDVTFRNVGSVSAENVTATLSVDKPQYVEITNNTVSIGDLEGNSVINIEDAFSISICDSVPNNTEVMFTVNCTDGTDSWQSKIRTNISAPEFSIINPDGLELEPGETQTVNFVVKNNGGSDVTDVALLSFSPADDVMVSPSSFYIPELKTGEETDVELTFSLADDAVWGVAYELIIKAQKDSYVALNNYVIVVGSITENFETGDFTTFEWNFVDDADWIISNENAYEGQYCAKSGVIFGEESTALSIELEVFTESEISFFKKVSSESGYDFFTFSIDGEELGKWSGSVDWSMEKYQLTTGTHTLRWTYSKDYSVSEGDDCAWLDMIKFPPTSVIEDVKVYKETDVAIYPNPNNGIFSVELPDGKSIISIYNAIGQKVYQSESSDKVVIDLKELPSGLYFVNVKNSYTNITEKVIIE